MKTKFFFFLAMLLMSSVGAFAQSETKTPLKGDVNEDGEVNAADVVALVDIIMKKNVDPNKYYWYIGKENPSSISNLQTDNTVAGWHEIGSSLPGFKLNTNLNPVHISDTRVLYYVVIPNDLHMYDGIGDNIESGELRWFDSVTCNIPGYKAFRYISDEYFPEGNRDATGIVILGPKIEPKYYWYIGTENPSSISNLQSNKTNPGWHEIGSSLSGFVLDTNDEANEVILDTSPVYYNYYVVIPNGLGMYDFFGSDLITEGMFNEVTCSISGYKAYQYVESKARTVAGVIIKEDPNYKWYWYIGADNPSSISNVQTDNTVGGWHEIGTSLSDFVLNTNNNEVHISDTRVPYYVIIPNEIHIYNSFNFDDEDYFDSVTCNINGYKAFKWSAEKNGGGATGVRNVTGIILRQ